MTAVERWPQLAYLWRYCDWWDHIVNEGRMGDKPERDDG